MSKKQTFAYRVSKLMPGFKSIHKITKPSDLTELAAKIQFMLSNDSGYTIEEIITMTQNHKINIKFRNLKVLVKLSV